ncbi:hypothetical protein [Streptomyces lincolnensis]|uniref:hypothetical protein n=1 Tax=Streptomyces lincolnensis TaxID=1915 RepID=UPI0013520CCA|nr:hypothetical protein [Streptomyces lincolnensis]QMV08014.1 hypothetical protein GJU35_21710 [Streptomyces lincolnensis]
MAVPVGLGERDEEGASAGVSEVGGKGDPDADPVGELFDERCVPCQNAELGGQCDRF